MAIKTVSAPLHINLKWGEQHTLEVVTVANGTNTLAGVTLLPPTDWEYVTYDGTVLDPTTTESFQEFCQVEFGFDLAAGDLIAIQRSKY